MDQPIDPTHALIERHGEFLRGLARALVRDEAAALDLEQDTWRAAIEHPEPLREPRAWLAATAKRIAWSRHRRDQRRTDREARVARPEAAHQPHPSEPALDAGDLLQGALRDLDEPFRGAIVARYVHGLEPREIAVRDGVPLETVKSRLKRGLERIRKRLDARHGGDRSAWTAALTVGLGLDGFEPALLASASMSPDPATAVDPTALATPLGTGGPLSVAVLMKLTLLAAGLIAGTSLAWNLLDSSSPAASAPPLTAGAESAANPEGPSLVPIELDAAPKGRSPVADSAPSPASTGPALPYTHSLSVETLDEHGQPMPRTQVLLAPVGHPLNSVGHTNRAGHLEVRWGAKMRSMEVDVVLRRDGNEFAGVQRIKVGHGVDRRLFVQAPVTADSEFEIQRIRLVEGAENEAQAQIGELGATISRLRTPVPEASQLEDGSLAFRWRAVEEVEEAFEFDALEDFVVEGQLLAAPKFAFVEGVLSDTHGAPVRDYSIRFDTPKRSGSVPTDEDGRFRIQCTPGSIVCSVGPASDEIKWTSDLASGSTTRWTPTIDRSHDIMIELDGPRGIDLDGVIFETFSDDGTTRRVSRAVSSDAGTVSILNARDAYSNVAVIAPEKVVGLPVITIDAVPAGRTWHFTIPDGQEGLMAMIQFSVAEGTPSAQTLTLFNQNRTAGVRMPVRTAIGGTGQLVLPAGAWWGEVDAGPLGTAPVGNVTPPGAGAIDIGPLPTPRFGTLKVPEVPGENDRLELHLVLDSVDSLVYDSSDIMDGLLPDRTLPLPPGVYRIRLSPEAGVVREAAIELKSGEAQAPDLP